MMPPDPEIPRDRRAAAFEEVARLAWAIQVHGEIVERYAVLGHVEGLDLAAKDTRACLVALLSLRKELHDE
jgi:hypothetical protein